MILNYCQALKFEDEPDYLFLRRLLRNLFMSSAFKVFFIGFLLAYKVC